MQTNPRCLIPENLPDEDLRSALRNKGLSTNGSRTEQEQRLRIADRSKINFQQTTRIIFQTNDLLTLFDVGYTAMNVFEIVFIRDFLFRLGRR